MTTDQKRIAIAEACGTLSAFYCGHCRETRNEHQRREVEGKWLCNFCGAGELHHDSPDYLNDLNAMHEAEKTLTHEERRGYATYLIDLGGSVFATAEQRAEAFLKAKGLWA